MLGRTQQPTVVGTFLRVAEPGEQVMSALGWVWPPALLALAIWMTRSVRRALDSKTRAWLIQPACAVLALAVVGGDGSRIDHHDVLCSLRGCLPLVGSLV